MSDEVVISVSNLSKAYRLGTIGSSTLKDDLNRLWARIRGQPDPMNIIGSEHHLRKEGGVFWALQDISFEVNQGQVLGIIGRNGAGKSTLLKILSRITAPTHGEVRVRGRTASLLEVGTGFHPDLTGRENVFLNGAIMGMTKAEIRSKYDKIVAFAEVEDFIDTPVKRYSSGMYVRLAFAVAAHLEPEILILDEVMAVGDAQFTKKCMNKVDNIVSEGRTVLFVSHNISAVRRLCKSCILLANGSIARQGSCEEVVQQYADEYGDLRNSAIAALVKPGSSVLDLGSGAQTLRKRLPRGCSYQPADLTLTTPDTLYCDFDKGVYPKVPTSFDIAVVSGVLEYLTRADDFLHQIRPYARTVLLSYNLFVPGEARSARLRGGWLNHFDRCGLEHLFQQARYRYELVITDSLPGPNEVLYRLEPQE
jgi:ABC-type polysaccharide/polyol phosphate transport system ATPase subunit